LQELVSQRREEAGLYREIAAQLPLPDAGRVPDIGTGTGLQLKAVHDLNPDLDLYGLDLSAHAIRTARRHLRGMKVDLREDSIARALRRRLFRRRDVQRRARGDRADHAPEPAHLCAHHSDQAGGRMNRKRYSGYSWVKPL